MQHQIRRGAADHTPELHTAWMNGSSMMVWENVFGNPNPWCPRDRSILRAMVPIQRRYHRLFCGEDWIPLVPADPAGVYASLWGGNGLRLWTLANRSQTAVTGSLQLVQPSDNRLRFVDLIAGHELRPTTSGSELRLSVPLRPRGVGAIVAGTEAALVTISPNSLRPKGCSMRAPILIRSGQCGTRGCASRQQPAQSQERSACRYGAD